MTTLYQLVERLYHAIIRPHLPHSWAIFAGVAVKEAKLLDLDPRKPHYKRGLIQAIHENVDDDQVTLVGLGRGVTTVHALRAGANKVVAYEAAGEMINFAKDTIDTNCVVGINGTVEIKHRTVGDSIEIYGEDIGQHISPHQITESDVLIMDCEGAELSILQELTQLPPTIIVETHPERGVPTEGVAKLLNKMYELVESRPYRPDTPPEKQVIVGSKPTSEINQDYQSK